MKNLMMKIIEEKDTVGIIICKQDNEYVIKYCSDNRIIAREYELVWYVCNKLVNNFYYRTYNILCRNSIAFYIDWELIY